MDLVLVEKINQEIGEYLGWTDLHGGGPHGLGLRGTPPNKTNETNCEMLPDYVNFLKDYFEHD